jgi:protein TonB
LRWLLILLVSIAAHVGLLAAFGRFPDPMPVASIPAITVDIIIGDNSAAGLARTQAQEEAVQAEEKPDAKLVEPERRVAKVTEPDTAKPAVSAEATPSPDQDATKAVPTQPVLSAQAETPDTEPEPLVVMPTPTQGRVETAVAARLVPEQKPEPAPSASSSEPARDAPPTPVEVPKETPPRAVVAKHRREGATPSTPSVAGGISRGGSAGDANYQGRVAAHLARHKKFPPEARRRGEHGSTGVQFTIDGHGRVTAVRIVRSSGFAALDRATEAMVWRASPFPAPPDRQAQRFSVPVSYSLR